MKQEQREEGETPQHDYQSALASFMLENKYESAGIYFRHSQTVVPDLMIRKSNAQDVAFFPFIDKPANPETAALLDNPDYLARYFAQANYEIAKPISVVNPSGTTIFTTAGVQLLDYAIHKEVPFSAKPQFIAQPVIRTQFAGCISQGTSISFINIATERLPASPEAHFKALETWLRLFEQLGFKKEKFVFKAKDDDKKWGKRAFTSHELFVAYDGLEIGDASYSPSIPQDTRQSLQVSDIGFGLERIKWILQGGSYFDSFLSGTSKLSSNENILALTQSLALIAGSKIKPGNKDHGYRFRQFSKSLVDRLKGAHQETLPILEHYYDEWIKWISLPNSRNEVAGSVDRENQRNFNRILIDELAKTYPDVGLDINQPTKNVIKALKGTSVDSDHLKHVLIALQYNQ